MRSNRQSKPFDTTEYLSLLWRLIWAEVLSRPEVLRLRAG